MAQEDVDGAELEEGEEFASIDELGTLEEPEPEQQEEQAEDNSEEQQEETEQERQERLFANKFKSPEELEKAYMELEKDKSRLGNEVGELRKELRDNVIPELQKNKQEGEELSEEDFWDNPQKAIERGVEEKIKPIQEELSQQKAKEAQERFFQQHPDAAEIYQSQEFQNWLSQNPKTQQILAEADQNYDADTASEVLSLYKQVAGSKSKSEPSHDSESLKEASVESSKSQKKETRKVFRSVDLAKLKRENPQRYKELWPEIVKAYNEGRVK